MRSTLLRDGQGARRQVTRSCGFHCGVWTLRVGVDDTHLRRACLLWRQILWSA
jgi:hypothetical protein